MQIKPKAITIKGKRYNRVSAEKFEVVVFRKAQKIELYIRPLDYSKNIRKYWRDLSELNYTERQFTDEMETLFENLKDDDFVQFAYEFFESTGFSLGMAFIAYSKEGAERANYIKNLKKNYIRDDKQI